MNFLIKRMLALEKGVKNIDDFGGELKTLTIYDSVSSSVDHRCVTFG